MIGATRVLMAGLLVPFLALLLRAIAEPKPEAAPIAPLAPTPRVAHAFAAD